MKKLTLTLLILALLLCGMGTGAAAETEQPEGDELHAESGGQILRQLRVEADILPGRGVEIGHGLIIARRADTQDAP